MKHHREREGQGRATGPQPTLVVDPARASRQVVLRSGGRAIAYTAVATVADAQALERYLWRVPAGYSLSILTGAPGRDLADAVEITREEFVIAIKAGAYGRPERALARPATILR